MGAGDHALVARAGVEWAAVWAGEPRGQVRFSRDPRLAMETAGGGDYMVILVGGRGLGREG